MPTPIINQIMANVASTLDGLECSNGVKLAIDRPAQLPGSPKAGQAMLRKGTPTPYDERTVPAGWVQWDQPIDVLVCQLVPEGSESPADDDLQAVAMSIFKKLREDINRGNLAIDTKLAAPEEDYPSEGSFYVAARVIVVYRTLWDDPFAGMGDGA